MNTSSRGYMLLTGLVFGTIFVTVLGALAGFVLGGNRVQNAKTLEVQAFAIAEAGLEYYRWFLAHYPTDTQNGTGQAGPYSIPYFDPEGGQTGTISLSVVPNTTCGQTTSIDINSTGTATGTPAISKTVVARYAQPTVAGFSYVVNQSVWAGADRIISGPYHSNGGVRMDGTANSSVTSSLATWNCTSNYGCSPAQATAPGVVGNGPNQTLWEFPVPQVDFAGITADFSSLKTLAQSNGIYYPRYSTTNNQNAAAYWRGYHMLFNADGTVTVRRVTATNSISVNPVNDTDEDWDRALISNETNYETRTIPVTCGLIFVEDNVWVEGTIPSKVTLIAANTTSNGSITPNAYLKNNIQYGATDGTDGLTLISAHNVLVTPDSPNNMTLNGVFIAQGGAFGRNLYLNSSNDCHTSYEPRNTLTILGTTVSNKRTGTKWSGVDCSTDDEAGYNSRIDSYDRRLATDPPAFTPVISTDYEFVDWRER